MIEVRNLTNAEKIRKMTDKELAEFIIRNAMSMDYVGMCDFDDMGNLHIKPKAIKAAVDWLNQEGE